MENHIQRDRLTAFADAADHASAHDKPGPAQRGLHRLQQCVAISAVDDGVVFGLERHRIPAHGEPEVRSARLAVGDDSIERSLELARGIQVSGDALEHAQVGVREDVFAVELRVARILRHPWPEVALAVDEAGRLGVGEFGGVTHGDAGTGRFQFELPDVELQRLLFRILGQNEELGAVCDDRIDNHGWLRVLCVRCLRRVLFHPRSVLGPWAAR